MGKIVNKAIISAVVTLLITSCAEEPAPPSTCGNGAYCYKNINFGPSRGRSFERGVRDGCRTAEGKFTKDYSSSSRDKNYFDGWMIGRSRCKQVLPNEGTLLEQKKSRQRAEYQIRQMKIEQESRPSEESVVDALLGGSNDTEQVQEVEY